MNPRPRGTAGAILQSYVGVLVFAAFIFLGAGTFAFGRGWLYVGLAVFGTTLNHLLVRPGSDITAERAENARAGEAWDRRLLGLVFLCSLAAFVAAGLDVRLGWTGPVAPVVPAIGAVTMVAGQLLFALAKRENTFFSSTVRLQTDRGHRVCDTGPYRRVRHPGYVGMLTSLLAFPLVVGAWAAVPPTLLGAALLVRRTHLEDTFLRERLDGYAAYADRVRWRLIPGIY